MEQRNGDSAHLAYIGPCTPDPGLMAQCSPLPCACTFPVLQPALPQLLAGRNSSNRDTTHLKQGKKRTPELASCSLSVQRQALGLLPCHAQTVVSATMRRLTNLQSRSQRAAPLLPPTPSSRRRTSGSTHHPAGLVTTRESQAKPAEPLSPDTRRPPGPTPGSPTRSRQR